MWDALRWLTDGDNYKAGCLALQLYFVYHKTFKRGQHNLAG